MPVLVRIPRRHICTVWGLIGKCKDGHVPRRHTTLRDRKGDGPSLRVCAPRRDIQQVGEELQGPLTKPDLTAGACPGHSYMQLARDL